MGTCSADAQVIDLDAVRVNFDGITYAKGASALKQLVAWVGEEEFLTGVRAYFDEFVPALRARGLTEGDIQALLVDNPARAFAVGIRRLEPSGGDRS